jgi:hypothetical protein
MDFDGSGVEQKEEFRIYENLGLWKNQMGIYIKKTLEFRGFQNHFIKFFLIYFQFH